MKTVIIGQSSSGKSALLASLHFAALRGAFHGKSWLHNLFDRTRRADGLHDRSQLRGFEVLCRNLNAPFNRLCTDFARITQSGAIATKSSEDVVVHEMELAVRRPWVPWNSIGKKYSPDWRGSVSKIEMPDGPGEAIFGDSEGSFMEGMRHLLIDHLRAAEGVILCLPPPPSADADAGYEEDHAPERTFFRFLHQLITEVSQGPQPLPWRRLAIAFTKADSIFSPYGNRALAELERHSTLGGLRLRLRQSQFNDVLVNQIRIATGNRVRIAAGYSSIYGFTADGTANYDPGTDGLLMGPGQYRPEEVDTHWRPFQILDPFLFAMGGHLVTDDSAEGPGYQRII